MDSPNTTDTMMARARAAALVVARAEARARRIKVEAARQEAASIVAHAVREILGEPAVQMEHIFSTVRPGITATTPIIEAWINLEGLSFRWAAEVDAVESHARYRGSRPRSSEPVALAVYRVCDTCGSDVFIGDIRSLRDLAMVIDELHVCPDCLPAEQPDEEVS